VKIKLTEAGKGTKTISFKGNKVEDVFKKMNLWKENYVVVKDKKIVLQDEKLKNNDKITIYCAESRG